MGFEPTTSDVTGRRSNRAELRPRRTIFSDTFQPPEQPSARGGSLYNSGLARLSAIGRWKKRRRLETTSAAEPLCRGGEACQPATLCLILKTNVERKRRSRAQIFETARRDMS